MTRAPSDGPPLVVHVVFRFDVGGLENGLVNLINWSPADRYRHAIVALTEATDFARRLSRPEAVPIFALGKRHGNDPLMHIRLWRLLRRLRPAILHTRNLPTLETAATACFAGVPARVHGEHGRDVYDLAGESRRYRLLRRAMRPFITRWTAVSRDLASWLTGAVGVPERLVTQIYNGVDAERFSPRRGARPPVTPAGFAPPDAVVFGTVGRMQAVKDQPTFARAFVELIRREPDARGAARLLLVGDGPLRAECSRILADGGVADLAHLAGARDDVPDCLRAMDVFVLPSIGEGVSNTILEAMAAGLPVIATRVGGNPEIVAEGETGDLPPPSDPGAIAACMARHLREPARRADMGAAGRRAVEARFSMQAMVKAYLDVYDAALAHVLR